MPVGATRRPRPLRHGPPGPAETPPDWGTSLGLPAPPQRPRWPGRWL